jgi:tetratricopeptide (TPR) repeat protein
VETLDQEKRKLYAYVLGSVGDTHFDNHEFQKALGFYERSVELDPDAFYLGQLGLTLAELGPSRDVEAVDALKLALEANPDNFKLWLALGNALFRLGRFEEALAAFEHVIGMEEVMNDVELQFNNIEALLNVGRQDEAKEALEQLTGNAPSDLRAHVMLGTIFLNEEDYQHAWDVLLHASTLPGAELDSILFYNLGYAALNLNMSEGAQKAFKQSLKNKPKNEQAKAAVKAFGPEKITLRKRISGARERQETLQEMLDRIKASLTSQRPAWIKRKSMEAIKMGFVKAMGGALTEMDHKQKLRANNMHQTA